jgi:DNA repair exonuclease SbcCD ATPase subunit
MSEFSELSDPKQQSSEDLAEVIAELEQYRERLLNDTLEVAQRAKIMKSVAMARLEPELTKIDATLQALRNQQAALSVSVNE